MRLFRRLALVTTIVTIFQIGWGGLVRATDSGLGCPRWPKCFGRWFPPLEAHAVIEWSHRFIAAIAMTLLIALAGAALVVHRRNRRILFPTLGAAFTIFILAGLGAIVVNTGTDPQIVTAHMATAFGLLGLLAWITIAGSRTEVAIVRSPRARVALISALAVYVLILIGAYVRGEGAGLAFLDWPLMNHRVLPALGGLATVHFIHRLAALATGGVLVWFFVRARNDARARPFAVTAILLYLVQVIVGGLQVLTTLHAAPVTAHVVLSALLWTTLAAAAASLHLPRDGVAGTFGREDAPEAEHRSFRDSVRAYVALTKPRIIILLLITTIPSMILARRGIPSVWLMAATVLGGALAAGAANTINMYFDRDIDEVMGRTRRRPLPAHRVEPVRAIVFACLLAATSFWFMTITVNLLSASLTQGAILFYVFVYTLGLKRSTPQNIVIGGAAGAVPALVGWAAVTGHVGVEAYILFCIIFFWTPPHFWALAMRYERDYASANVPMLPVVAGARATQRQILLYSFITVGVTLSLWPVARMGAIYIAAAGLLGAIFVRYAVVLWRRGTPKDAMALFRYSITYLALLFTSVGVDAAVRARL